jgi:peptidyl-prolyl cis-trans isomerase D
MFKQLMRSPRLKSRVVWILLLFLIPPFLFFFSSGSGGGAGPSSAAGKVFGREIPWQQFQDSYRLIRQSLESRLGGPVPETLEPYLRDQAWERIILNEEARRRTSVTDRELAAHIQTQPAFQQDGRFSRDLYYRYVRAMGHSPKVFEEHLRDDLRIQKLLDQVKAETTVTDEALKDAFRKEFARLRTALVATDTAALEGRLPSLTEAEIQARYAADSWRLAVPAKRRFDVVGLSAAAAQAEQPAPSEEQLRAYYDAHLDEFKTAEGVTESFDHAKASIVDRVHEEQTRKRLKTLALDLHDAVDQHWRLEEAATATGIPIRQIGPVAQDEHVEEIPSAVVTEGFETPVGRLSDVVETPAGVYLLRPTQEAPSYVPTLDQVRGQFEGMLQRDRAHEAAVARAQQLRDEAQALRQGGMVADWMWQTLHLTPERPEPFVKADPPPTLSAPSEALEPLFATSAGQLSPVIPTESGAVFALVEESLPPSDEEFAQRQESFRTTYLQRQQDQRVADWLARLRERARLTSFLEQAP